MSPGQRHGARSVLREQRTGSGLILRLQEKEPAIVMLTKHRPPTATRLRVLLVDDYPDSAETASMLLALHGYDCRIATTGGEALEQAAAFEPDVVILDIGLPDMSGYEVARMLRAHAGTRSIYLAAVTGWGKPEDRDRAFAAGFDCYVTKPADLDKLSMIVKLADQHCAQRYQDN